MVKNATGKRNRKGKITMKRKPTRVLKGIAKRVKKNTKSLKKTLRKYAKKIMPKM